MKEILKKLHKYEIAIRKAINTHMKGDFHSVFKGTGLDFDEVRQYQYGDDIRTINWNVSAKGHGTFVKTFKEEKEQTVFFVLDVSASQYIGNIDHKKIDLGKEVCGVLTLSAIKEQSKVGVVCFSDQKEKYIKVDKGLNHAYQIIYKIFSLQPKSVKTSLSKALQFVLNTLKRRSIIIVISDFLDVDYMQQLTATARKHDLVVIHISDKKEKNIPSLGIIPVLDKEAGKTIWVNSSSSSFKKLLMENFSGNQSELEKLCRQYRASYLSLDANEDFVPKLIKLFKVRNNSRKW